MAQTLADLTVQLANEAGVSVKEIAASLAKSPTTAGVAKALERRAAQPPPASAPESSSTALAPRSPELPAPRFPAFSWEWWTTPVWTVSVPIPGRPVSVGVSPVGIGAAILLTGLALGLFSRRRGRGR